MEHHDMSGETILIVDDEPTIVEVVELYLRREGFEVQTAVDGLAALKAVQQQRPDLIVLDLMLPGMSGLELTRQIRASGALPIIMLTARGEETDRVVGLELGADDYVTKPFSPRELVARVNVILRRARPEAAESAAPEPLAHGLLTVDPGRRSAVFAERQVELTPIEFAIVSSLLAKPSHVLTRHQLMDGSHAANIHVSDRTIDSHIRNIRAKFAAAGCTDLIATVHGVGFRLGRCGA
jgi:two-component system OmpR family response regulator